MLVSTSDLLDDCKYITKMLSANPPVEAYRMLHIGARYEASGLISLYAFDGSCAWGSSITCLESTKGFKDICVDRNQFLAAARRIKGKAVDLRSTDGTLRIDSEDVSAVLPSFKYERMDAALRDAEKVEERIDDVATFAKICRMCASLSADKSSNSEFSGVMFSGNTAMSTDGHRFTQALLPLSKGCKGFQKCLIPIPAAKKLASATDWHKVYQGANTIAMTQDRRAFFVLKKESAAYPSDAIPVFDAPVVLRLPANFKDYAEAADKFSDAKDVMITVKSGELDMKCVDTGGGLYDAHFVGVDCPDVSFRINLKYLIAALKISRDIDVSLVSQNVARFFKEDTDHIVSLVS